MRIRLCCQTSWLHLKLWTGELSVDFQLKVKLTLVLSADGYSLPVNQLFVSGLVAVCDPANCPGSWRLSVDQPYKCSHGRLRCRRRILWLSRWRWVHIGKFFECVVSRVGTFLFLKIQDTWGMSVPTASAPLAQSVHSARGVWDMLPQKFVKKTNS